MLGEVETRQIGAAVESAGADVCRRGEARGLQAVAHGLGEAQCRLTLHGVHRRVRVVDVEAVAAGRTAVGVDAHHRVRVVAVLDLRALVDARAELIVVSACHGGTHAQLGQLLPNKQHGVPREGVLGVSAVGGGAAGLTALGATAAVGHLIVDRTVIGAVVPGIEHNDASGDTGCRACGEGGRCRWRGDRQHRHRCRC
ncbi:Uncharacterised protein [Mycobacteroides abscessus subsp. abscessus]|nr:Uncharacterised protein [Mycobacteroides abscessus subsp. abscessus]SHT60744.1 Uncharacterised protein [Mycobacteroides abscessus subsp. abscessus]SHT81375.1 Uncharacterised protein [Mycobacteroides abscessus subsp. abscessus]SHV03518.1 Uncharacterised protein [Mycobacteroides abscessus subsp. abscessus]SIB62532.1 Uncharacterised protein [Mycobacteroides abscessus subsp. abscessus]